MEKGFWSQAAFMSRRTVSLPDVEGMRTDEQHLHTADSATYYEVKYLKKNPVKLAESLTLVYGARKVALHYGSNAENAGTDDERNAPGVPVGPGQRRRLGERQGVSPF